MLLPLHNSRRHIETLLTDFIEQVKLFDPDQYLDRTITANLQTLDIKSQTKGKRSQFLSIYLQKLPFLKRLSVEYLRNCIESE